MSDRSIERSIFILDLNIKPSFCQRGLKMQIQLPQIENAPGDWEKADIKENTDQTP